ncbi:MAG: peptide ABC transporter substrate-binding protein [Verrucomicrobiota bacterium JB022]|nr:peptide ABC transporter substrate-binding protein [Verrucomicrobiota bacterium JB022]
MRPFRPFCLIVSLICLLLAGGCRRTAEVDLAAQEGYLLVGTGPEPESFDPQLSTSANAINLHLALWEGLTAPNPQDLSPQPGVAESWDVSPDGLTYTFHLRPEAKWSNGEPLTAQDFAYAWQRLLSPAVAAGNAAMLYVIDGAEAFNQGQTTDFAQVGVRALDTRTLQVRLDHRVPDLLERLMHPSFAPLPRATVEAAGEAFVRQDAWARPGRMVSNGPFRFSEWRPNERIVVERNPHYWNDAQTSLQGVRFFPITDLSTEERAFQAGQLHVTEALPPRRVPYYQQNQPEVLRVDPYLGTYYYLLNHEVKPLDDVRVRRALSAAIDRRAITEQILQGGQQPALQFTPERLLDAETSLPTIEEGKQLLAEAGYPNGEGFPALELVYNASETHQRIAEAIQSMWQRAYGITVNLSNVEAKTYYERRRTGEFAVARAVWIADYVSPQTFLEIWTSGHSNNYSRWGDTAYDALLEEAARATTPEQRRQRYAEAERYLEQQAVMLPIYHYTTAYLIRPEVKGWTANPLDWHPYQYVRLQNDAQD